MVRQETGCSFPAQVKQTVICVYIPVRAHPKRCRMSQLFALWKKKTFHCEICCCEEVPWPERRLCSVGSGLSAWRETVEVEDGV